MENGCARKTHRYHVWSRNMSDHATEIGGYFELERFDGPEYHEGALALNCARGCLAYLIEARGIRGIWTPWFLCESVDGVCRQMGVEIHHFEVGLDLNPDYGTIHLGEGDYLYLVDYYGQLSDEDILRARDFAHGRVIVDEVMAFFRKPLPGLDTIYSCRKFFGVADGGYLYTDARIARELPQDESHDKMEFVLARCERPANDYYPQSAANNKRFVGEGAKRMSAVTRNLLRAVDYEGIASRREENFCLLAERLDEVNQLQPRATPGAFMYPLLIEEGPRLRRELQARKVYVSMLWGRDPQPEGISGKLATHVLPMVCDQRYGAADMQYEADLLLSLIGA